MIDGVFVVVLELLGFAYDMVPYQGDLGGSLMLRNYERGKASTSEISPTLAYQILDKAVALW